ncbi:hypothetical protein, partial [Pseudomonas syringae group genomosp. 7]|uniref:hypothetical protein n=1 Tax=Pseudomonas syringae group genomosp. 7 TaxID=251699 RepID=UPI00377007C0
FLVFLFCWCVGCCCFFVFWCVCVVLFVGVFGGGFCVCVFCFFWGGGVVGVLGWGVGGAWVLGMAGLATTGISGWPAEMFGCAIR